MSKKEPRKNKSETQEKFISSPWQEHNIYMLASASKLWNTKQEEAIEYGNLIHEMMSKIYTEKDIPEIIESYTNQGSIQKTDALEVANNIKKIVTHPKLIEFFSEKASIYNEREIVTADNQIIIPDRLILANSSITIIDYKTGKPSKAHHQQLLKYGNTLKSMNFTIHKKLLVYIGKEILVEEI